MLLALSLATLLGATAPAHAEDPAAPAGTEAQEARAREIFDNGERLYTEGDYASAILAFEEAYALSKRHVLLFNIANAYERWGKLEEAIGALNTYRVYAKADEREALERRIHALEARRDEQKAAAVVAAPAPVLPAPSEPEPEQRRGRWVVAGVGLGVAGVFGATTAATWAASRPAIEAGDEQGWGTLRALNNASGVLAGAGAGLAVVGLAIGGGKDREGATVGALIRPGAVAATTHWTF